MGTVRSGQPAVFLSSHPECRAVVKPFLTCFDVTHASTKVTPTGNVTVFFLKPETFIAEFLGLEREMLLLFSPHAEFQARTMQLHDEIANEHRTRLDPAGSILVSNARNTPEAVSEYLVREPERPPILALSAESLTPLKSADDVRAAFADEFFRRDLFALESPLRGDISFFGRQEQVASLVARFRAGQNTGLFGLRRIGKTSVLHAIARRAVEAKVGSVVYMDLTNPSLYQGRWWTLLQAIVREAVRPLELPRSKRSKVRALSIEYAAEGAAAHFKSDVSYLLEHSIRQQLLIALDEIEMVTFDVSPAQHWSEDFLPFWQTMRSVHQELRGAFSFMLAGVNPHPLEVETVGRFDNPLFSTTSAFFLPPFDVRTVRGMVRRLARYMGLRCEEELFSSLTEEYGGHPFLVRQACSQLASLVRKRPGELTADLFIRERANIGIRLEKNVRQILNVLAIRYPYEYELLSGLAAGDVTSFTEFALASAEFTQHVEGYGLVKDARTSPEITIGLVRDFLIKMAVQPWDSRAPTEPQDVEAEISRRRNAIERKLRRVISEGLRYKYGTKNATAAGLASLPERRRQDLMQYSYDEMWEHTYFNELASVIERNWEAFGSWFADDKTSLLSWLEHINRLRVDAHAKSIGEEDLALLRVCFRRLEDKLGTA